jgi:4-diphosphocytidyl-2-C-methyl-D-erythritol kinase
MALPALAGRPLARENLSALGESLGSDVPFFLHGGTALGLGRGSELYPLPDLPTHSVLVVSTGIHVSTAEAYRGLGREVANALTSGHESPILREFQAIAWALNSARLEQLPLKNDFEAAVFKAHPELAAVVRKLRRLGGKPAMMTGSGSAVFGVFETAAGAKQAAGAFRGRSVYPARFLNRRRYQALWRRALGSVSEASCFGGR